MEMLTITAGLMSMLVLSVCLQHFSYRKVLVTIKK